MPRFELPYTKMHGTRNSFVVISNLAGKAEALLGNIASLAKHICSEDRGLGADGLVLVQADGKQQKNTFAMIVYNKDGSRASICGNALRCVTVYLKTKNLFYGKEIAIKTDSGVFQCQLLSATKKTNTYDACLALVKTELGMPHFKSKDFKNPATSGAEPASIQHQQLQEFEFQGRKGYFVSMGNPHAVFLDTDSADFKYRHFAETLQKTSAIFPNSVNVEFVKPLLEASGCSAKPDTSKKAKTSWAVTVVERGVGETLACGSGACAVAAVLAKKNPDITFPIELQLKGGKLTIYWDDKPKSSMFAQGEAEIISEGTFLYPLHSEY